MRRREVLNLIGGALIPWPSLARAQPADRLPTVGVIIALPKTDPEIPRRIAAFEGGLRDLGWTAGRNLQILYRFAADIDRISGVARELIALAPEVIVASSGPVATAVLRERQKIPVVFISTSDPIGNGMVSSLARPDGNATGFTNSLWSMGGKWVELLKQIAPNLTRVGFIFSPDTAASATRYFLPSLEDAAKSYGVTSRVIAVRTSGEIDPALAEFGREPSSGLIVAPDNFTSVHRKVVIAQAARHRIPAIYPFRYFAADGGLMAYGADLVDLYRRAPAYVDRILRGAKVADLPVQAPAKFELVINLKAAEALGLTVPRIMLARADEVIE